MGLVKGLAHCHKCGIIHRDLKPENLLVDDNAFVPQIVILKIADFGLSRCHSIIERKCTIEIVSLWYRSPEILLGVTYYDTTVDIWSVGCIFGEIVMCYVIFHEFSKIRHLWTKYNQN